MLRSRKALQRANHVDNTGAKTAPVVDGLGTMRCQVADAPIALLLRTLLVQRAQCYYQPPCAVGAGCAQHWATNSNNRLDFRAITASHHPASSGRAT
jgi:hypothetical protein